MNKVIPRFILTSAFALLAVISASAQFAIVDQMGQPFLAKTYTDVRGSAYLYDTWMTGSVTTGKGVTYEGVQLMYDQMADELMFKSEKGEAKTFIDPISEFSIRSGKSDLKFKERVFRRGFIPVDGANPYAFYEVLADGPTQLLKRTSKKIFEELPYGSSTKVKTFESDSHYYIAKNDKLVKVKNDKKAILKALPDKKTELEAYIKANRLDLKNDEALANLVGHYNDLTK
ncbi:hypothetical protein ABID22_001056 [Pontibacter aydingkolensis]|uniref:GLPGLI family protein n=1 Tax=Pontibacter aydingkolensis TaxID=1911536 RepID=A0ABS7CTF8_9BACT|nr:hypothetical protein [Pontibacter aydingkolensis]MBW7466966.1 hypothetical protein [Pontibacter aydingkolensis]